MSRLVLLALPITAVLLLPAFTGPGAEPARSPQEFSRLLDQAERAFARKDYLSSVQSLEAGIRQANQLLRSALLDAMPLAPDGFVEIEAPAPQVESGDPIATALSLRGNRSIETRYRKRDGLGEMRVLIAPNSPAVATTARAIAQAEEDPNSSLVEVGSRVGVLAMQPTSFTIRFALGGVHFVEVRAHGTEPETVLRRINTAFLDRVARILGV